MGRLSRRSGSPTVVVLGGGLRVVASPGVVLTPGRGGTPVAASIPGRSQEDEDDVAPCAAATISS